MALMERTAPGEPTESVADAVRVLVVDDEPAIADLVGTALRYEGFDVATPGSRTDLLTNVK
jgi:CheY-like chemotaxis protein